MLTILQKNGRENRTRNGGSGRCLPDVSRGHTVPVCPGWPQLTAFCKQHNRCLQSACCSRGFHIWVGPGPCLPTTSPFLRACHKASHGRKVCSHAQAPMIPRGCSLWASCASCSCSPKGSPCSRNRYDQEQTTSTDMPGSGSASASLAQLVEHALRKHMVVGSIPTGGSLA